MLIDFLSHPSLSSLPLPKVGIIHCDAEPRLDAGVAFEAPKANGRAWRMTVDHSYFTGKTTEFSFAASDCHLVERAIAVAVQAAVIDHQNRTFSMLASINTEVINSLDGSEIVRNVLHEVRHVIQACESGVLRLFDEESGLLVPVALDGLPEDYRDYRLMPNESISGEVFSTQMPVLLNGRPDIVAAHRVMRPESQSFMERSVIANALMCVPVVAEGKCLGTLTTLCFSPDLRFAPFDLAILQTMAAQIAIGYRRSQSYQEAVATSQHLEEAREELTRKNAELDSALSLHESLLHTFASEATLNSQLDAVARLYHVDFRFDSVLGIAYHSHGWRDENEVDALTQTVEVASIAVGRFMIRPVGDPAMLRALFGTVAAFVALDVMRNKSQLDLLNVRKGAWFDELASNPDERRNQFGFHPDRQSRVIVSPLPGDGSGFEPYRVLSEFQTLLPTALAFHRDEAVVLVVCAATSSAMERHLTAVARIATSSGLSLGASGPREWLADLRGAYAEALQAARAQGRRAKAGMLRHGDMGIERILSGRTRGEILEFSRQILAPLTDPRHCQLLSSLLRYVAEGKSVSRTAQALNIHPNTLYQRLQRIETLIGRSLSDPVDYTLLSLACQLSAAYEAPDPMSNSA